MSRRTPSAVPRCLMVLAAGAGLLPVAAPAQAVRSTGGIYTCINAQRRLISSDRPIPECRDREVRELGPSGAVRRVIPPAPSAEERERAAARQRAEAEAAAREAEERRREALLLQRYPDAAAHDRARESALRQVEATLEAARAYAAELERERQRLDAEMEFYQRDPSRAPPTLKQWLAINAQQRLQQAQFIADQEREKTRIGQRFDAERKMLQQLWGERAAGNEGSSNRP